MKKLFTLILLSGVCGGIATAQEVNLDGITYYINQQQEYASITGCDNSVTGEVIIPATVEYNGTQYPVKQLDGYAFWYSKCTSITFPENFETVKSNAIYGCEEITSLKFPSTPKTIESKAVQYCDKLDAINLPSTIENIAPGAFFSNIGISAFNIDGEGGTYTSEDGVIYTDGGSTLYMYPSGKIIDSSTYTIPENITKIADYAFNFARVINVELPSALTEIGAFAFYDCDFIPYIEIPASVSKIGNAVFSECGILEEIYVDSDNQYFSDKDGILMSKDGTTLMCYPLGLGNTTYTIPEGVDTIQAYAFEHNETLTQVNFPKTLEYIGDYAFQWSTYLQKLNFNRTQLKGLGLCVFTNCSSLDEISFPPTMESIGLGSFWDIMPSTINCWAVNPPAAGGAFSDYSANLFVQLGSGMAYEMDSEWGQFNIQEKKYESISDTKNEMNAFFDGKRIIFNTTGSKDIFVFNAEGKQMFNDTTTADYFDLPNLPAGVYVIRIISGNDMSKTMKINI